jgi:dolichyl-phosphate-mannose--protein O-mannosyl transferase
VTLPSPGSCEDLHSGASGAIDPMGTGLPVAWWPSVAGAASLMFSVFWMMESWEEAEPLRGPTKVNFLTQSLAGLLASLICSYAIYRFWKRRSATLGIVLGLVAAGAAMTLHRM